MKHWPWLLLTAGALAVWICAAALLVAGLAGLVWLRATAPLTLAGAEWQPGPASAGDDLPAVGAEVGSVPATGTLTARLTVRAGSRGDFFHDIPELTAGEQMWMPTPASLNRARLAAGLGLLTAKTVTVTLIFEDVPPGAAGVLKFNPTRNPRLKPSELQWKPAGAVIVKWAANRYNV